MRKRYPLMINYIGTNCPYVAMLTFSGNIRKTLAANIQCLSLKQRHRYDPGTTGTKQNGKAWRCHWFYPTRQTDTKCLIERFHCTLHEEVRDFYIFRKLSGVRDITNILSGNTTRTAACPPAICRRPISSPPGGGAPETQREFLLIAGPKEGNFADWATHYAPVVPCLAPEPQYCKQFAGSPSRLFIG
jgi:hypothetical protein